MKLNLAHTTLDPARGPRLVPNAMHIPLTRSFLKMIGRGLVAVLLLAQMAMAAYACPALSSVAAMNTLPVPATPSSGGPANAAVEP